ncbi:MAG TPA: TPM domain-containing protein [Candidatus Acidoferrales bacterium]|nr:TPM domain-containing protein [Candidatus Acidoferrales bacterium]
MSETISPQRMPAKDSAHGRCLLLIALVLGAGAHTARGENVEQLKPQGYVNDFAGVLDPEGKARLSTLAEEVDKMAGAQIAVVTVRSLEGLPIEEFSIRLATRWGIGPKKSDRGVLILLATEDRKYRVEVGYGLEPILPDGKIGGFGREMVPLLVERDYGGALFLLTSRIAAVIAQDRGVTLPDQASSRPREPEFRISPRAVALLIFLGIFLAFNLLAFVRQAIVGGARYRGRERPGTWWFPGPVGGGWGTRRGGWGGGGFGGAGGFGGFGGGGFGGGGASGSW